MDQKNFAAFTQAITEKFMQHPAVTSNAYTAWFAKGDMPLDYLRHFTVQFSVFSNQFLLAALNRVINAETLESARESKEILINELGVVYNNRKGKEESSMTSTPRSSPPKAPSTAARSVSRPRTSSGCCASARRSV